jgi:hypothetical protein
MNILSGANWNFTESSAVEISIQHKFSFNFETAFLKIATQSETV